MFGAAVADRILDLASTATPERLSGPLASLTERERDVLSLLALGLPNATIADRLHLSQNTVGNHLSNVFTKLGVTNRGEAIIAARTGGIGS